MNALQSKIDAQMEKFLGLLESHTESVHSTLHQHLVEVDSKVANLHVGGKQSNPGFSGSASRTLKLSVPRFDGSNLLDWIFQIEAFFNFHETLEESRLQIVAFHLDGRAAAWFQWATRNNLLSSWQVFLTAVRHRFSPTQYEDIEDDVSKLSQTGSVADFQAQFEDLMNKVTCISESLLISFFITGLKKHLRRELQFHRPATLMEAFTMARAYEARFDDTPATGKPWSRGPQHSTSQHNQSSSITNLSQPINNQTNRPNPDSHNSSKNITSSLPPLLPTPHPNLPVRNIPSAELRDRRSKGLCFKCDEK